MNIKKQFISGRLVTSLIIVKLFVGSNCLLAQSSYFTNYDWSDSTTTEQIDFNSRIILDKKEIIEYHYENDNFLEFYLKHQKEYLATDKNIEDNNRVFINLSNESDLILAKARVIKPGGDVVVLSDTSILHAVNEETGQEYSFFAFEGIEQKSIIEYLYAVKKSPNYNGRKRNIQGEDSIVNYNFDLIAPVNLIFKFKTMNDTNQVKNDTTFKEKNRWYLSLNNIPGLKEEQYAPMDLLYKQVVYKLDRNTYNGMKDISSYGIVSQNVYKNVHDNVTKQELKVAGKVIKLLDLNKEADNDEVIWEIDNYLKNNIRISKNQPLSDVITDIYKSKMANEFGMVRFYTIILKKLDIDYNIVITCDRTNQRFDKEFESHSCITDYLLYFPSTGKYLSPGLYAYRYGLVPANLTDNYGLFIKETSLGEFKTGIGKVKFIEPLPYNQSYTNLNIIVDINETIDEASIKMTDTLLGYKAVYYQPYINLLDENDLKEMVEEKLKTQMETIDIIDWKVINAEPEDLGKKPLIISCNAKNNDLIEKAGKNYLFKVGELIGPQMELYSEDKRKLPLYSWYKRQYIRNIEINIPEGYTVKNLDDLNIYTDSEKNGKQVMIFDSHYSVKDQKIIIVINEFYDQLYFDKDEYYEYRKVVNSASDFNKVVLVLEEKEK